MSFHFSLHHVGKITMIFKKCSHTFLQARTIFLRSYSVERPWIVVKVLRPFRCWIRMCTKPSWTPLSSPLAASAKGSIKEKCIIELRILHQPFQSRNGWVARPWELGTKNIYLPILSRFTMLDMRFLESLCEMQNWRRLNRLTFDSDWDTKLQLVY